MKNKFGTDGSNITIDMLNSITHTPALVVKERENDAILKNVSE
jgi:F420-0:gamma-glutamyl ligase-like protein